jgi:cytochrome c biogenesis protein CcdA/glutaredoxin
MGKKPDKKQEKKPGKKPDTIPDKQQKNSPGKKPDNSLRIIILLLAVAIIACAAIFGGQILQSIQSALQQGSGSDRITLYYFYGEECPHCHNVTPYINSLRGKYPDVDFQILETWHNNTNNKLLTLLNNKLGRQEVGVPEVIVGNVSLLGENEIKAGLEKAILAQKGNLTGSSQLGASPVIESSAGANTTLSATYFYGNGCTHCENIKPLIAYIRARYPELQMEMLEIKDNRTNLERFLATGRQYGLGSVSTPTIFIGEYALVGETEVKDHFEEKILAEKQRIASGIPANMSPADPGSSSETPALSPFMVVFAALVDSANPCGLSVLVFLLISMAAAGDRKRILLVGGVYIAAMFLFHLLVGIGLFSALALSGLSKPFSLIGGAIALILGVVTLADVLRDKETFLLSIPESGKGLLGKYIRRATLPAVFILGILAGLLGFSCTGGIYISILGLMGRGMTVMAGLPWLVLYNIVYVLPLILVTLLVAYGLSPARADRWRTEHKRTIRVIIGVILVALGLVILFGWIG